MSEPIERGLETVRFGTIEMHSPPRPGEPCATDIVALVEPAGRCHCGASAIARVGAEGQTPVCIRCLAGLLRTARAIGDELADVPPEADRMMAVRWLCRRHPEILELAARLPGAIDSDGDLNPALIAAGFTVWDMWQRLSLPALPEWILDPAATPCTAPDGEHDHSECDDEWSTLLAIALSKMTRSERNRLRLIAAFSATGVLFGVHHLDGFDQQGRRLLADWLAAVHAY
jgi:hypothetical protein